MDSLDQFAARLKLKFPVYKDIPDSDLVQKVLMKFPEYQTRVQMPEGFSTPPQEAPVNPVSVVANEVGRQVNTVMPKATVDSPIGQELIKPRLEKVGNAISNAIPAPINPPTSSPLAMAQDTLHGAGQMLGTVIGGISAADVITLGGSTLERSISALLKRNVPGKNLAIAKLAETDPAKALKAGVPVTEWQKVDDWVEELKRTHPNIQEAEWEPVIQTRAKNMVDEVNGVLPAKPLENAPMVQGPQRAGQLEQGIAPNAAQLPKRTTIDAYHGSPEKGLVEFQEPTFHTTDPRDAAEYAYFLRGNEGGQVYKKEIPINNPLTNENELVEIIQKVDPTAKVEWHGKDNPHMTPWFIIESPQLTQMGKSQDNLLDFLYLPAVRKEIAARGYDAVQMSDPLYNSDTPAVIPIKKPITPPSTEQLGTTIESQHVKNMRSNLAALETRRARIDTEVYGGITDEQNLGVTRGSSINMRGEIIGSGVQDESAYAKKLEAANAEWARRQPEVDDLDKEIRRYKQKIKKETTPVTPAQAKAKLNRELKKTPNVEPWAANKVLEVLDDPKTPIRMPKEGFLNVLKNKQVKPEQLEWDGLNDFLKGKEKVTKQEVRKFVEENGLNLIEIDKADTAVPFTNKELAAKSQEELLGLIKTNDPNGYTTLEGNETHEELVDIVKGYNEEGAHPYKTSYGHMKDLQMPGGENYREKRFQLPQSKESGLTKAEELENDKLHDTLMYEFGADTGNWPSKDPRVVRYRALGSKLIEHDTNNPQFTSGAYPEPGIVAETRYTDRKIGKDKVLFLEEVQSHMHQAGRAQGYRSAPITALPEGYKVLEANAVNGRVSVTPNGDYFVVVDPTGKPINWEGGNPLAPTKEKALEIGLKALRDNSGIPNAPFKAGKHVELVMKRMVRQAIEEGKDAIAWTTGKMQKDRYNLAKQVSKINVDYLQHKDGINYQVTTFLPNGNESISRLLSAEDLPGFVGKDLAQKIVEGKKTNKHTFAGLDLEIGGKWADNLYNQQMVNFANKFFGKWGAKVTMEEMTFVPPKISPYTKEEMRVDIKHIQDGTDSFEESQNYFKRDYNYELTQELFDEIYDYARDPYSRPPAQSYVNQIVKELTQSQVHKVPTLRFTDALKRAALKQGFPLFAVTGAVGLGASRVSSDEQR